MMKSIVVVVLVAGLSGGCASIVKGSSRPVQISLEGPDQALCSVSNRKVDLKVQAPAVVSVKPRGPLTVRCTAAGYADGTAVVNRDFAYWTLGNLFLGGVIGLAVDGATGAIAVYKDGAVVRMQQSI